MKALKYLQKVGAIPAYEAWDVLMSIVVIVTDFFSPELSIPPYGGGSRNLVIYFATSGNVRALFPHIHDKPVDYLKELLEELIDIRLRMYIIANGIDVDESDSSWFSDVYNNMVDLKGKKRFPSKSTLIHTYCSGSLTDGGQEILSNLAGTQKDFEREMKGILDSFSLFLSEGTTAALGSIEIADENSNPFVGGYQAKVNVVVPGVDEPQQCTLHWAPWPSAKTKSANQMIRSICDSFTEMCSPMR